MIPPRSPRCGRIAIDICWLLQASALSTPSAGDWVEVRTAGTVITTDAGEERGVELMFAVEEIRAALESTLPGAAAGAGPLPVLALVRSRDFFRLLPEYRVGQRDTAVAGAFFRGPGNDDVVLRLDAAGVTERSVVYHEVVHSLTGRVLPGLPVWLEEGLGELWSTAIVRDGTLRLGEEHRSHREHLRRHGLVPLAELIRTPERSPGAPPRGVDVYASAWALAHHLVVGGAASQGLSLPVVWGRLEKYVEECRRRGDPLAAFEASFGSLAATASALADHLARDRLPAVTVRVPAVAPQWQERPLRQAEVEASLGAFLVRRGAMEAARPYLAGALAAEPDLAPAVEAMGHLAFAEGDDDLAVELLRRALEIGGDELVANHLLVATLRREGGSGREPQQASSIIRGLVALQPEMAPAWVQLAETYARSGASWSLVVDACRSAVSSRPGSAWFRLLLARAALVGGLPAEAEVESRAAVELVVTASDATLANNVCWYGGVGGLAAAVLPACEHAVRLAPARGLYRDSRALVRTLQGDLEGARQDLRAFLVSPDAADSELRAQRSDWLRSLEAGVSPFSPAFLEELSDLPF